MAVVKPFTGWHYNPQKFENLSELVAPPYDVISSDDLAKMKNQNPYNFTHIILNDGENKHQLAAQKFKLWQEKGEFVQDPKPCFYFYKQIFKLTPLELFCQDLPEDVKRGGALTRTSIFARIGLEDYSSKIILPHEKTFSGPKADRYNLMEAAQGNMEPVFLGYDSPRFSGAEFEKLTLAQRPLFYFKDGAGVEHYLWAVDNEGVLRDIEVILKAKKFFILDGHHRYETALKFYKDHQKTDARLDHRYVLAAICSFRQPGTVILPTHRALKNADFKKAKTRLQELGWSWTPLVNRDALEQQMLAATGAAFGIMVSGEKGYYLLEHQKTKLDLEMLHELVLPQFAESPEIDYIKDIAELESGVDRGTYALGILVRPSTIEEVMRVAENGKVMPHKSTFFYPKIPSGLLVNTFT